MVAPLNPAALALKRITSTMPTVFIVAFDGCNSGELDVLLGTLTHDVIHYFLDPKFPPICGAEHLAKYWRKYKTTLDPVWSIDRIVAQGDEVVTAKRAIETMPECRLHVYCVFQRSADGSRLR